MSQPRVCLYCAYRNQPSARYCGACGQLLTRQRIVHPPSTSLRSIAPLPSGSFLGLDQRYRIDRLLSRGGFGEAYLAEDVQLNRLCVVKRLSLAQARSDAEAALMLEAFAHEARLLVALNTPGHPNIPEIFAYLPESQSLVMKYITGSDLLRTLKVRPEPMAEAEALRYVRDACAAVVYMHSRPQPVLHRDLKPQNLMLDEIGRVWLIDFGLAYTGSRAVGAGASGTPGYAPPEQWQGVTEPRSDVYALGATLYELLTQQRPPHAQQEPPPPLRQLNPAVRLQTARLVERSMAYAIAERPTAAAFLAELEELLASVNVPPPPEPAPIPLIANFIGRTDQLHTLAATLARTGLVTLVGMPGVGKTTLAARLAQQVRCPEQIFWHTFRASERADGFLSSLAGWLAHHGRGGAWQQLQLSRQAGEAPLEPAGFAASLGQLARGGNLLLCLDDAHLVGDSVMLDILAYLQQAAAAGDLALIVAGRRAVLRTAEADPPLCGFTAEETSLFLATRQVTLDAPLVQTLHAATEGNPQFLLLAADLLRKADAPAPLITRLAASAQLDDYLLSEVDERLSTQERAVMGAVALLLGEGGTAAAVEAALDGAAVQRTLVDLARRHLLRREADNTYQQHAMVQAFYYRMLSRRERSAMHRRVAGYFAHEAHDPLQAARHYSRCGDEAQVAMLLSAHPWQLIAQGHAGTLRDLLAEIAVTELPAELRAATRTAQGEAAAMLGDYPAAQMLLEQAIADEPAAAGHPVRQARRYRLLAQVYERVGDYKQAETACRQGIGLATSAGTQRSESARLYAQLAEVFLRRGALAEAAEMCHAGLAALPPTPAVPGERGALLHRLATITGQRGYYNAALDLLEQSLELARQAGDPLLIASVLHNSGLYHYYLGQYHRAQAFYEESLRIKEELGDLVGRARTISNLGILALAMGDQAAARQRFEETKALSERLGLREQLVLALSNLGQLAYEQGQLEVSRGHLEASDQLYGQLGDRSGQAYCRYLLGDVELVAGNPLAALAHGQTALALARTTERQAIEGCAQRVIGEALLALGQPDMAAEALSLARAIQTLVGDPYDEALLLTAQARLHMATGQLSQARTEAQTALTLATEQHIQHLTTALQTMLAELA